MPVGGGGGETEVISRRHIAEITIKYFIRFDICTNKKTVFGLRLFLLSCVMLQEDI